MRQTSGALLRKRQFPIVFGCHSLLISIYFCAFDTRKPNRCGPLIFTRKSIIDTNSTPADAQLTFMRVINKKKRVVTLFDKFNSPRAVIADGHVMSFISCFSFSLCDSSSRSVRLTQLMNDRQRRRRPTADIGLSILFSPFFLPR